MIELDHVTKLFRRSAQATLRHTLAVTADRLRGRPPAPTPPLKALDDISLAIAPGEVVGLVGHNGAGKTTLLKLISRICEPTRGAVRVRGRVAPLIALGAAMVPDFTGRENLLLNAVLLGMSRRDVARHMDEIIAFAGLEDFIDTPLKRYSTGMQARLGFAVATAVPAEILLVDEVLAVGDLAFQRKCLDRIGALIREGRTVIIVGHDVRQIGTLCPRMVWLDHGRLMLDADAATVCNRYFRHAVEKQQPGAVTADVPVSTVPAAGIRVTALELRPTPDAEPTTRIEAGGPLHVRIALEVETPVPALSIELGLHSADQLAILRAGTGMLGTRPDLPAGRHTVECSFERLPLNPDPYSLSLTLRDRHGLPLWQGSNLRPFLVEPGTLDATRWPAHKALLYLPFDWRIPSLGRETVRCDPLAGSRQ